MSGKVFKIHLFYCDCSKKIFFALVSPIKLIDNGEFSWKTVYLKEKQYYINMRLIEKKGGIWNKDGILLWVPLD